MRRLPETFLAFIGSVLLVIKIVSLLYTQQCASHYFQLGRLFFSCVYRAPGLSTEEKRQQNVTQPKRGLQELCSVASVAFHSMKGGKRRKLLHIPA